MINWSSSKIQHHYSGLSAILLVLFLMLGFSGQVVLGQSTAKLKNTLQERLVELEGQINQYRSEIQGLKTKERTLEDEIKLAGLDISKVERQIEATELALGASNARVKEINKEVQDTESELTRQRSVLGHFLIILSEYDSASLAEVALIEENFHDFFLRYQTIASLQGRMLGSIKLAQELKARLEERQAEAEDQRAEELALRSLQQHQRASLNKKIVAKQSLIKDGQVRATVLNTQTDEALQAIEQVRKHLYVLQGLSGSMSLETAYAMAARVSGRLNIRPSFLMALIKKESDWGSNVGSGNWKRDMHPRDHASFLEITKKLGLDPDAMPVSAKPSYGWGGAMGPAQFLPTTWLAYEAEVAVVTGHNPPSPWNLEDAFAAAAIKLSANGANKRTWYDEWKAAQIYFAGRNWNKPQYSFYGDSIMELAEEIESQISG